MKIQEAKSIIDLVRNSTLGELFFTSLIIFPIFLGSWVVVLKQLDDNLWNSEFHVLIFLSIGYALTLLIMKFYQRKEKKIEIASIKIRSYILSRKWTRMSFERINKNIDRKYTEELLNSIIDKYPEDFRKGTIKGGKISIVVLGEEDEK